MTAVAAAHSSPALSRLHALASISGEEAIALERAMKETRRISARREMLVEGKPVTGASILLSGWAGRVHQLSDGRRQILGLLLPGDLIGACRQSEPLASSTVMALTDVTLCTAPKPTADVPGAGLGEAYAMSAALDEANLLRHITRLGRLSAHERIADWLLELRERLTLCGLATNSFAMPLTQETLADTLGLTSVHVNRTLQTMRKSGALVLSSGRVEITDPQQLAVLADHRSPEVSEAKRHCIAGS